MNVQIAGAVVRDDEYAPVFGSNIWAAPARNNMMVDLSYLDLSAIAEPADKLSEATFFFELASKDPDRQRFRWLVSAFLNAAYSFFDTAALHAFHAHSNADGDTVPDEHLLSVLHKYVHAKQTSTNDPYRVHTAGKCDVTLELYEVRKRNTHHFPMSIMIAGPSLPRDYHLGSEVNKGRPALAFCEQVLSLIQQVQGELDASRWGP